MAFGVDRMGFTASHASGIYILQHTHRVAKLEQLCNVISCSYLVEHDALASQPNVQFILTG
jgi:hypothetical protein